MPILYTVTCSQRHGSIAINCKVKVVEKRQTMKAEVGNGIRFAAQNHVKVEVSSSHFHCFVVTFSIEVTRKARDVYIFVNSGGSSGPALMSSTSIFFSMKKGHREALKALSRPLIGSGKVSQPALEHSGARLTVLSQTRCSRSLSHAASPRLGFL